MKKKLKLTRITIAQLTSGDLQHAVGAVGGQQSRLIGTVWEPCQIVATQAECAPAAG
jgi:hypothetical protein